MATTLQLLNDRRAMYLAEAKGLFPDLQFVQDAPDLDCVIDNLRRFVGDASMADGFCDEMVKRAGLFLQEAAPREVYHVTRFR